MIAEKRAQQLAVSDCAPTAAANDLISSLPAYKHETRTIRAHMADWCALFSEVIVCYYLPPTFFSLSLGPGSP